jgi:hypothetical protein
LTQRIHRVRNAAHVFAVVAGGAAVTARGDCRTCIGRADSTGHDIAPNWFVGESALSKKEHPKHHR